MGAALPQQRGQLHSGEGLESERPWRNAGSLKHSCHQPASGFLSDGPGPFVAEGGSMRARRGCSRGRCGSGGWLTPRPQAKGLLWESGCQHYLRVLEFLLYWNLNWPGNWGVTSRGLLFTKISGCSVDKRCRLPPALGLGRAPWALMSREDSSGSKGAASWRGNVLAGWPFYSSYP